MHSRGHSNQIRQASCNHGRSCNWSSRLGDGSPYVSVFSCIHSLFFLTQSRRLHRSSKINLFEDYGCLPSTYFTWPTYPIVFLPPIFIGLFSATYSILTIFAFYEDNAQSNIVISSNGNFTSNWFLRLMCLASFEVPFNIPIASHGIYLQSPYPFNPYFSWESEHYGFSHVQEIPTVI